MPPSLYCNGGKKSLPDRTIINKAEQRLITDCIAFWGCEHSLPATQRSLAASSRATYVLYHVTATSRRRALRQQGQEISGNTCRIHCRIHCRNSSQTLWQELRSKTR